MKKIAFMLAIVALAGCEEKEKAPEIGDINNIVIEGQTYTAKKYVETFCGFPKAEEDKNCFMASKKASKDMSKYRELNW